MYLPVDFFFLVFYFTIFLRDVVWKFNREGKTCSVTQQNNTYNSEPACLIKMGQVQSFKGSLTESLLARFNYSKKHTALEKTLLKCKCIIISFSIFE